MTQQIRYLLTYVGQDYEERNYHTGPPPEFNRDSWYNVMDTLGLDFPDLPYYIDGNVKLTKVNAIMRYIARKHNLCGTTEEERTRVDLAADIYIEFRGGMTAIVYNDKYAELKDAYAKSLPGKLKQIENFLGKRKWFAGENITFVDFAFYEHLFVHRLWEPKCLDNCPNLAAFLTRFEAIPSMKKFIAANKLPVHDRQGQWGHDK